MSNEKLEKANKPGKDAMKMHPFYRGKMETVPKCRVSSIDDFAIWYTPGVAEPCKKIQENRELVYEYTNKWNTIAVISDGTRVLGLGDIGPEAALPVMEGKALIFKYLGGVDAIPICLGTKDKDEFINICKKLQPSFGGFNLEDISQPKCFDILDSLRKECEIPVWHDDQQGTAAVTVAGVINALKVVKKNISDIQIAMIGAGASNICISQMLMAAGADPEKIIMCDSKGTLHAQRDDLKDKHRQKWNMCLTTNKKNVKGSMPDAIKNSDLLIALSTPGPDLIKKEWISTMRPGAIVFSCANPVPEIWPWDAKAAGAAIVATGRSDFPNQVNNSLGFPGIFRGALDVRAKTITNEMCLAAAYELAEVQQDKGLDAEHILPTMDDWEVFAREAAALGMKAMEQGIAGLKFSREELYRKAEVAIRRAREQTRVMMEKGFIPEYKDDK
jgi:malate dehydrogenase (oxaloacetate-decarboxylating)